LTDFNQTKHNEKQQRVTYALCYERMLFMSSKKVWSVEGYEDNGVETHRQASKTESFTNEADARKAAKKMADTFDHLDVYVIYTNTVNGKTEERFFNSNGSYSDEGFEW